MNFYDVIAQRRSCRTFQAVDVVQESLERILSACTKAPTAGDLHSFQIVVIRDAERRQRLAEACHDQKQVANAPVVLVFCALPERSRGRYHQRADMYSLQDASIACTVAMLAATAEGLGSCWVGAFVDDEVARVCLGRRVGVRGSLGALLKCVCMNSFCRSSVHHPPCVLWLCCRSECRVHPCAPTQGVPLFRPCLSVNISEKTVFRRKQNKPNECTLIRFPFVTSQCTAFAYPHAVSLHHHLLLHPFPLLAQWPAVLRRRRRSYLASSQTQQVAQKMPLVLRPPGNAVVAAAPLQMRGLRSTQSVETNKSHLLQPDLRHSFWRHLHPHLRCQDPQRRGVQGVEQRWHAHRRRSAALGEGGRSREVPSRQVRRWLAVVTAAAVLVAAMELQRAAEAAVTRYLTRWRTARAIWTSAHRRAYGVQAHLV